MSCITFKENLANLWIYTFPYPSSDLATKSQDMDAKYFAHLMGGATTMSLDVEAYQSS